MPRSRTGFTPTIAVVFTCALALASCAEAEPDNNPKRNQTRPVSISVDSTSREQLVVGEVYKQVLELEGRMAHLSIEPQPEVANRVERLRSGSADMIIGCTGTMLDNLDPRAARELKEKFQDSGDLLSESEKVDITYREFVGIFPARFDVPDPSSAQGCESVEATVDLPRNIVPVYHREMFDRNEQQAVNELTRILTEETIEELVDRSAEISSISTAVAEWVGGASLPATDSPD